MRQPLSDILISVHNYSKRQYQVLKIFNFYELFTYTSFRNYNSYLIFKFGVFFCIFLGDVSNMNLAIFFKQRLLYILDTMFLQQFLNRVHKTFFVSKNYNSGSTQINFYCQPVPH